MNKFQYSPPSNEKKSTEELIKDLQDVALKLDTEKLSQALYEKHGKFHYTTIERRFGGWNSALIKAGLKPYRIVKFTDEMLFENLLDVWQQKGAQPTRRDMDSKLSKISAGSYRTKFRTWTEAIKVFINYANSNDISVIKNNEQKISKRQSARDPSLRLRFKVLKRDNFSCIQCGASPAKNQNTILHIDHIKPWSKGGETEISNLQTLCERCNLGKSNLE